MVKDQPALTYMLTPDEEALVRENAKAAEIGGVSRIHRDADDRAERLSEDQLIGQIGPLVFCKHQFGTIEPYKVSRFYANLYPTKGDGGFDIPRCRIDVKTSLMRASPDPLDYKLLVRPHERHTGCVYVLVMVETLTPTIKAHICGWATDEMLPREPKTEGPFAGAYLLPASQLLPMMPMPWVS
jgi:hypothetical protein